ncbi:hypothetical protein NDU88_010694 [Pleurodeles waltl]|uniref:Uncharacterized protein n=1 Tax=Pleurodeles waltl TaxID=8319 RepID=A0AAV7Q303_PLEWA|nr:hypothetical protein NDU88_010694 [Pleurodeles waltl]
MYPSLPARCTRHHPPGVPVTTVTTRQVYPSLPARCTRHYPPGVPVTTRQVYPSPPARCTCDGYVLDGVPQRDAMRIYSHLLYQTGQVPLAPHVREVPRERRASAKKGSSLD